MEGQLFTFVKGGPIHWSCMVGKIKERLGNNLPVDVVALLDLNRHIHEGILVAKDAEAISSEDARAIITARRKALEGEAAKMNNDLFRLIETKYQIRVF
jgi:hypothetical protein